MRGESGFGVVGLDAPGEAVYRRVLSAGTTTPDEIARSTTLEGVDVPAVLEELRRAGLVNRVSERDHYSAVDPRVALRSLTERTADRLDRVRASIPALAELFDGVAARQRDDPAIRVVDDPGQIGMWYVRLEHEVRTEFLAFDRPPYVLNVEAGENPVEPMALARGVDWRVVYAAEVLELPGAWAAMRHAVREGERARVAEVLPTKLAIADRRIAIVSSSLDPQRPAVLVVEAPPLVELLCTVFDAVWASAAEVPPLGGDADLHAGLGPETGEGYAARPLVRDLGPSDEDRALLALLNVGAKDDVIARQLGMSGRTLRRRTVELFERLGAANRFQAGVEAARRGWL